MYQNIKEDYSAYLQQLKESGLFKPEYQILADQKAEIYVYFPQSGEKRIVLNFCANNYLGLANHPSIIAAAHQGLARYGFGLSSVRFICGTLDAHKKLEKVIADFFQTEDTILYSSCFDANTGLFEALLGEEDGIVSDALNHASIIDGIRLCKAKRFIYEHNNLQDLEKKLKEARQASCKKIIVATDGVFSMDGEIADLKTILQLARKYDALLMVDDSHATGFLGENGRGSLEYNGVLGEVDIITSTLGKAMGGASGGFTTGRKEIIEVLRQKSRPYLFSNTLAPVIVSASLKAFELITRSGYLRRKLINNTCYFRNELTRLGFDIISGEHPIIPVLFRKFENDAILAQEFSRQLLEEGIYAIGFFYPVVPKGQSRVRIQISAAHTMAHLKKAVKVFEKVGKRLNVI